MSLNAKLSNVFIFNLQNVYFLILKERSPILSSRPSMHKQKKLRNDDEDLSDNSKLKIIQKDSILGKNKTAENQQSIASAASDKIEPESIDKLPERSKNTGPSSPKG